jgi:uncharacterized membrane protein
MPSSRAPRFAFILFALLALVSLACFAYPLYVIRPFRYQGAKELQLALFIARIGPWLSILCAVACLALVVYVWPRICTRLGRVAAVVCVVLAALGAFLVRFNLYERMLFHPIPGPQFESADHAKIDPDDMVLAVRIDHSSHAYPIREIAYHHVVNDTLSGLPIAATY